MTDDASTGSEHASDEGAHSDGDAQRRTVREGYDALADDYGESRDPPEAPLVESFLDSLPDDARLLDVGCGQGTPVLDRLPADVDAAGLDFSVEQLRYAREVTDADLLQADMTALPIRDDSADALTALHSLIHVPTEQHPAVIREFGRITGPDAKLLLTANQDGWLGANDDWLGGGARMEWSFPAEAETREQLRDAGFAVVDEELVRDELGDEDDDATWLFLTAEKRSD